MAKICLNCFISGRVQGVYYRDSTQRKAKSLGVTGWVRNLPDGRVEVMACGEEAQVAALREWLWQGPPAAAVREVIAGETPWQDFENFAINY